jgi:hypothetical protein
MSDCLLNFTVNRITFPQELSIKIIYPLNIYQHTKLHGHTLTGAIIASTLDRTSVFQSVVRHYTDRAPLCM